MDTKDGTSEQKNMPQVGGDLVLRSIAFMIDWTLISIITVVLCILYMLTLGLVIVHIPLIGGLLFSHAQELIYASIFIGYHVHFEGTHHSATPGKKICGLQVLLPETANSRIKLAALRGFCKLFSQTFMFLGFLPAFFRKDRRAVHDLPIGSDVIQSGEPHPRLKDFLNRNLPSGDE